MFNFFFSFLNRQIDNRCAANTFGTERALLAIQQTDEYCLNCLPSFLLFKHLLSFSLSLSFSSLCDIFHFSICFYQSQINISFLNVLHQLCHSFFQFLQIRVYVCRCLFPVYFVCFTFSTWLNYSSLSRNLFLTLISPLSLTTDSISSKPFFPSSFIIHLSICRYLLAT